MLTRIQGQHEDSSTYRGPEETSARDETSWSFSILNFFFIFTLWGSALHAQMLKHEVGAPQREFYDAKKVCKVMGVKHTLLVSSKPPATLDCMGRDILVSDFCEKVTEKKPGLLRGRLDPFSDKVVCEYGQTVNVTYRCSQKNQSLCTNSKIGCLKLGGVFARSLKLSHSSLLPDGADHRLNCYFSSNEIEGDAQLLSSPFEETENL